MLVLRYAGLADAPYIEATQRQPEVGAFVGQYGDGELRQLLDAPDQAFLLALRDEDTPVGFAHLRGLASDARSIELYRLALSERGKGYGGVFLELIMEVAFGSLNANRLWLDVFPENTRARKVYARCGFIEEGTLREVYAWNGRFKSAVVMSVLAREFNSPAAA